MDQYIIYDKQDGIARIKLNRPEKLNALNPPLMAEMWERIWEAEADDDVRVIIISGEGRAFSTGGDMDWLVNEPPLDAEAFLSARSDDGYVQARARSLSIWDSFWDVPKPIISQVHGYCLAGACEVAFFSDLTIASDDAVFGEPETKHGWVPASLWLLGPKVARELMLFGDPISAEEAHRIGLVNRVVPRADLEAETQLMAERLMSIPRASLAIVKRTGSRFYKAMGFTAVAQSVGEFSVYTRALQGFQDNEIGFNKITKEKGLRAALQARDRPDQTG